MDFLESKILGCLVGAATGDAMGAATELRTQEQIYEKFGGYVRDFLPPPNDTFAGGNNPGQITDDFSCAYCTCLAIIKNQGTVSEKVAVEGLLEWAKVDAFFAQFAGPTTRAAVEALKGNTEAAAKFPFIDNSKASNGAAMKISPVSLFSGGNIDKAIENAIEVCRCTHNNNIALSGAGAVAAATAAAMKKGATIEDLVKAGLYGAKQGDELGRKSGNTLAGPSVLKRIELAVAIASKAPDRRTAMQELSDIIGTGLAAAEAVPAVFGLIVASKGDTQEGIFAGVNIGNDTDTIATMIGGILGTLNGFESMPKRYLEIIDRENNINLAELAGSIRGLLP